MATGGVYSLLSVQAALLGPGGAINLGAGSGIDDEGISIEMLEPKDSMVIGADGSWMHSLNASKAGRIRYRVLKTAPVNLQLSALYNLQSIDASQWGQNTVAITDTVRGDVIAAQGVAFEKQTDLTYAKNPRMNEWVFLAGQIDMQLGAGI